MQAQLSDRARYALVLLAAGLSPEEASERVKERLGIEISPRYVRNLKYRKSAQEFVASVRPTVLQATLSALLAPAQTEEIQHA